MLVCQHYVAKENVAEWSVVVSTASTYVVVAAEVVAVVDVLRTSKDWRRS